jgi:hypothetical protein
VVTGDGVPDEGHGLSPDEAEEGGGVEAGEVAAMGLPPPPEDGLHPRLTVLHAVHPLVDQPARRVRVVGLGRVGHPLSYGHVARRVVAGRAG